MDDKNEFREAITSADATGMVAGEELITEAETVLPTLSQRPAVPHEKLHAALAREHPAHATIDRLASQIGSRAPDRREIEAHVNHLRALPELEAVIANWWDDPQTQRFIFNLSQIGL